jgi:Putative auto-transporter adhesin, head GIN domain
MIHLVKIVVATVVAFLFSSCNFNFDGKSIKGSGNVVSKERNLKDFTKITVSRGIECVVTQGSTYKVVVEADDNVQEGILTTVENGTLKITSEYNNYHNVTKKVRVQLPTIEQLETTSGSDLRAVGVIKSNSILLKSSSGSDLYAQVESEKIALESSSGSDLKVEGKAIDVTTASSSGSHIDAEKLLANNIISQSSSGSTTDIHPLVSLKAKASSGSSIDYFSHPKNISKEESSGGSVDEQ